MSGLVLFFDLLHFFIETTKRTHRFMLQLFYKCRKHKHITLLYYRAQTHMFKSQYLFEKKFRSTCPGACQKNKTETFHWDMLAEINLHFLFITSFLRLMRDCGIGNSCPIGRVQ